MRIGRGLFLLISIEHGGGSEILGVAGVLVQFTLFKFTPLALGDLIEIVLASI